jgi:hypothetical protein
MHAPSRIDALRHTERLFTVSCSCGRNNGWKAVLDTTPPDGPVLLVQGTADCLTAGYGDVRLEPAESQSFNPRILVLELKWTPPAAPSPDVPTPYRVRYERANSPDYERIVIANCENRRIPVEVVS